MRNISTKADNVGDVLPATDFNALNSELENAVTSSDQTLDPEGGPDTDVEMLGKAITIYANASQYYQDSGAANAYVLARVGNLKPLVDYIDGVTVIFKAGNSNTGASTINVDSLGAKALRDNNDTALVGGEIIADGYVVARYNSSNDRFEILFSNSTKDLPVPASGDELQSIQVNAAGDGYELCGPLTSFKNKIINGNFDLWDYATSQTSSGYGSDNRWGNYNQTSTKTHSQQAFTLGQTDVPGEPEFYSSTVVNTTGGGASNFVYKSQKIESVRTFAGKDVTLSLWAKADSSKDMAIEVVQFFGTGGSPSSPVSAIGVTTLNLTTSWQKFEINITIPSISGKTLGTADDDYLEVILWFDAGTTYAARTNSLASQTGTFDIAQVQIEAGPVATQFDDRNTEIEKTLCRRFLKWMNAVGTNNTRFGDGYWATATQCYILIPLEFKLTPSVLYTNGSFLAGIGGSSISVTALAFLATHNSKNYASIRTTVAAGGTAGYIASLFSDSDSTTYIGVEGEL